MLHLICDLLEARLECGERLDVHGRVESARLLNAKGGAETVEKGIKDTVEAEGEDGAKGRGKVDSEGERADCMGLRAREGLYRESEASLVAEDSDLDR